MKTGEMISATSSGVGNPVFIVGSRTGKDGIHGLLAQKDITEESIRRFTCSSSWRPLSRKVIIRSYFRVS